jgi:hypothetical protein
MPGQLHITPFCAPQQMDDENPYDAHISGTARGYPKPFALWELRSTQSAHRILCIGALGRTFGSAAMRYVVDREYGCR